MRGKQNPQPVTFFAINLDDRIRTDHPLRPIKQTIDAQFAELNPLFDGRATS